VYKRKKVSADRWPLRQRRRFRHGQAAVRSRAPRGWPSSPELLHEHPHAVLMGDFSCDLDCAEMAAVFRRARLQPPVACRAHVPSWRPQRAIDNILLGNGLTRYRACELPAAQSDHLALSLELDVPERALRG